jgi:RNA polymerase sigma-70 factor, ECF subfamily
MPIDHRSDAVSNMAVDEFALVGRVAVGDPSALETLYHSYYHRLASFLWCAIGHRKSVEEIIYDTFTWVWISAGNFREVEPVSTWIFRKAYRKALEHASLPMSPKARYNTGRSPGRFIAALNGCGFSDKLRQGLRVMPFVQRLTLLLTYQMGYSLEQIAAITGVRAETVAVRMLRAREALRGFDQRSHIDARSLQSATSTAAAVPDGAYSVSAPTVKGR